MMDNVFILKSITILVIMLAGSSEGIFFNYPKKALVDFLHSLKEKKELVIKKSQSQDVHHYHLHYYPVPVSIDFEEPPAVVKHLQSGKIELEQLHSEQLRSSGWSETEYKHVPEPSFIVSLPHHHHHRQIFSDQWVHRHHQSHDYDGLTIQDQLDIAAIRHKIEQRGIHEKPAIVEPRHHQSPITLHLPFHQEIILHAAPTAPPKEEKKEVHPFIAFFQKLQNIKNSLFNHSDTDEESVPQKCDDKIEKPAVALTSNLREANAFAIYFHPKYLKKYQI